MKDLFYKELMNFGLSDKEAKIYVSLLELEVATVFEIAKHAGINRSSAYVVLEGLRKKGLVGISDDKKVRHYVASNPEVLLHTARVKAQKHDEIKTGIESIVPELKALHKDTKRRPVVKVFEGKNGLISLFEDSINCQEAKLRVVSAVEPLLPILGDYVRNFIIRRIKKGIRMYSIHPVNQFMFKYMNMKIPQTDHPLFIPRDKYKNPADFAVYDSKIAYMSPEGGGFGVLIESKEVADVMKSVFDLAYEEAKRIEIK